MPDLELDAIRAYRALLLKSANQLEDWSNESISGGWSTHQVSPMRCLAREIFTLLGKTAYPSDPPAEKPT